MEVAFADLLALIPSGSRHFRATIVLVAKRFYGGGGDEQDSFVIHLVGSTCRENEILNLQHETSDGSLNLIRLGESDETTLNKTRNHCNFLVYCGISRSCSLPDPFHESFLIFQISYYCQIQCVVHGWVAEAEPAHTVEPLIPIKKLVCVIRIRAVVRADIIANMLRQLRIHGWGRWGKGRLE